MYGVHRATTAENQSGVMNVPSLVQLQENSGAKESLHQRTEETRYCGGQEQSVNLFKKAYRRCNCVSTTRNEDPFITADSRATEHAVNNSDYFVTASTVEHVKLTVADGATEVATHILEVLVQITEQIIHLENVCYFQSLNPNKSYCSRLD